VRVSASAARGVDPSDTPGAGRLLAVGTASSQAAKDRFTDWIELQSPVAACLLNITTAMGPIQLRVGTPLDYFQQLNWDPSMAQDRFFGYADAKLID
jgi:hypothetical protein